VPSPRQSDLGRRGDCGGSCRVKADRSCNTASSQFAPATSFLRRPSHLEKTLSNVRREFESGESSPIFVKPQVETKTFAGCVLSGRTGLERLQHLDDELRLQASEPVDFVSEWRYYIHQGTVVGLAHYMVGLAHYKGEWSVVPDKEVVREAVSAYSPNPVAYSLDFGVTSEGRTLLVEANDAFALGAHGIDAVAYAKMLEDRWLEITGG
jgi:hypothetical protein